MLRINPPRSSRPGIALNYTAVLPLIGRAWLSAAFGYSRLLSCSGTVAATHGDVQAIVPGLQSLSISRFPRDVVLRGHIQHRHPDANRDARLAGLPFDSATIPNEGA
jgi:hypothetical protein